MGQLQVALLVTMEARPGKEAEAAALIASALPLVEAEPDTAVWFGFRIGASTFGIFDAFPDDHGRQAHLAGKVAAALMAQAPDLFVAPPCIEQAGVLASKVPG